MPVDTSSYKLNQVTPANPLDTIMKFGQANEAMKGVTLGGAMQGAVDPATGQIDQNKLLQALVKSPTGAQQVIPVLDAIQKLKQAGYATDQAGLETFQKRMATTYHLFSHLASKDKPTGDDVLDVAAKAMDPKLGADKFGITLPVIMQAVSQFKDPKTKQWLPADQIKKKALEIQTMAASTAEILQVHSPRVQWVERGGQMVLAPMGTAANPAAGTVVTKNLPPTTQVATPDGPQYLGEQPGAPGEGVVTPQGPMSRGGAGAAAGGTPVPSGPRAGLAPGQAEATTRVAEAGAASANRLTESQDTAPARKTLLANMEHLVKGFEPGAKADWSLFAKQFASRNLPVPDSWRKDGAILDPKSIASQEEFNKMAMQLAQAQFATIGGTGTDTKFSSAFETSPNEQLSRMGNVGIIRLLKGNEDAIIAKNKAWQEFLRNNGGRHDRWAEFSADFNSKFDPRVFQFKYVPAKERQAYFDSMDNDEQDKFLRDLTYARKRGWVSFEAPKDK